MHLQLRERLCWLVCLSACLPGLGQEGLPNTQPLTLEGDLSARMVAGIDKFLSRETDLSVAKRQTLWKRDFSSPANYEKSVEPNRQRLREAIGAVDARVPALALELAGTTASPAKVAETDTFVAQAVRWPVFEGVCAEGLWLQPKRKTLACVVAVPDAGQTPEMIAGLAPGLAPERQFARRLVENGCEVLAPVLIDRQDTWSGSATLHRFTNQPHREWLYRQAYEVGRHIIGYEAQKVFAAVDWFAHENSNSSLPASHSAPRIGVAGYGEGGLVAFYAAALDSRVEAVLVSGYFDSRQRLFEEPIYRNVWGLLREFGDAEIATLIAPRALIVEHSPAPKVDGPPAPREGRSGAAPGRLGTPDYDSVETEFERARALLKAGAPKDFDRFKLICGNEGMATGPGSDRALAALLNALGARVEQLKLPGQAPVDSRPAYDAAARQQRQVKELEAYTQKLFRESERVRADFFWNKIKASTPADWERACVPLKQVFGDELIGKLPSPDMPANPRSRRWANATPASSSSNWTGYEVVLDVYPDVFAWGYLLVPNKLQPGERRPVVVCQHGLSGVPQDTFNQDPNSPVFKFYHGFAARLAEDGFVVFAPHNPYRDGESFRPLQRKANPLKQSLFSVIVAQHERALQWLAQLPFVDAKRIGFYGLSYGGAAAMRVPAVLDGYALSICSANFNDWARKNVSVDSLTSYLFRDEYEMPEFNLANTFNYAEMAALIAPRPFMVERGHSDGVAPDEWVAGEYAPVRRLYDELGVGERAQIEFFNGGHAINGAGTFDFLRHQLNWH